MDDMIDILILETGTLGVRISTLDRVKIPRKLNTTKLVLDGKEFTISYKTSEFKGKMNFKIEFEDLKSISTSLNKSIRETEKMIREEILKDGNNE